MESPTHETYTNDQDQERSDLTHIRGIGAIRKQRLHLLGIYTIADLAQASADEIESQLKNGSFSRNEIEQWIAQAQAQLADSSLKQAESPHDVEEIAKASQSRHLSEAEFEKRSNSWNSIASFKVEYQTREVAGKSEQQIVIYHLETGAIESWSDFETQLIQQWMRDRVETNIPPSKADHPVVAEITQLRVIQPHQIGQPMIVDRTHPLFPDAIQTAEPFALEVSMQFAGLTDANLEKQEVYRVQCMARNLSTGSTTSLGDVTANVPLANNSVYKVLLPQMMLPHPGIYRLKVLVTRKNASATFSYFKVPMLQVV